MTKEAKLVRSVEWSAHYDPERASLRERLCREGYRFEVFQAVRLFQLLWPERNPVGWFDLPHQRYLPSEEVVHFRAHLSLHFPSADIQPPAHDRQAEPWVIVPPSRNLLDERNEPGQITVAFGTLTGPYGPLPLHYTDLLLSQAYGHGGKRPDPTLRDFLDLFNHCIWCLHYRAWEKTRMVIRLERRLLQEGEQAQGVLRHCSDYLPQEDRLDAFSRYLYSLMGLGTDHLRGRQEFNDDFLLGYSGLLSTRARSASALQQLVSDWLSLPPTQVEIEQFTGDYYPLPEESQTIIGIQCCLTGEDAMVGDAAWVQDAKFRVRLGPMSLSAYASLLPAADESGKRFRSLVQLIRFFVGPELDFDIQLLLGPDDLSRCVLGAEGEFALRVGLTAWVLSDEAAPGLSDTIFAGTMTGLCRNPPSGESDTRIFS